MIIVLSLITTSTLILYTFQIPYVQTLILSLLSTMITDMLFLKIRNVPKRFTSASVITGLIIGLVASPLLSWYQTLTIGILAMVSKNFIRVNNRHIMNPAAFGLLVSSFLFGQTISWWGLSWQSFVAFAPQDKQLLPIISFLILLSPFLVSALRFRRYRIQLSFLISYILSNLLSSFNQVFTLDINLFHISYFIFHIFFDPTLLFFTAVMLPEPMTTPSNRRKQLFFGIFVALVSTIVFLPVANSGIRISNFISDPLIFSLLLANVIFFFWR